MHIHFIIHESYEGPGALAQWVETRGHKKSETHLYRGEQLAQVMDFDLLIILGGPQSPQTTVLQCAYFDVQREVDFIAKSIVAGKAVLGICLGAQLIGEALGAKFETSPNKEIGYFPITLTAEGKANPLLQHFQSKEVVGHWHNDMPGITEHAKILAYSEGCPRQIVAYGEWVYGFQCHLEFTQESVQGLIESAFDNTLLNSEKWVQQPSDILKKNTQTMNNLQFQFLDDLLTRYKHQ
ncbi:glutamine amidotransferase-related protein [Psychromonas sp. Urea-02u-13]|uniref:glutamine amidotransferase-related protein n=1 Tax=Psychromonas sp. Urea-02u-13 TaxID=2058326 RepID=UPI000C325F34|nr:GMP synthase [Psychromonas sp. Urea-02u-13]PKG39819.1 GMP synthase [Psychromonas sp. Urea-02u-13]